MSLSIETNERSQTFFLYYVIYLYEFLNRWHFCFLMAIGQSDSLIEVIKKFDTYLFFIFSY